MKKSKFTETQIVAILKQADAGVPIKDICRQAAISSATYYQWKSKYGGMEASDLKRVKELEAENSQLKRMYAELALDDEGIDILILSYDDVPQPVLDAVSMTWNGDKNLQLKYSPSSHLEFQAVRASGVEIDTAPRSR
jgi:putative transposase